VQHQTVFLSEEQFRNLLETKVHKESVNMYQDWEEAYRAAVLETDHNRLIDKIDSATTVLRKSLLETSSSPEHVGERQRIEDALRTLDMIRRIDLKIPA
jgi:isopropylmalate/homocitrate/citramalate synthase